MTLTLGYTGRDAKPRRHGRTVMIDTGLPHGLFRDVIRCHSPYVDAVKFGWTTGLFTDGLPAKARLLHAMEIASWCGGTFFEMAWAEGKLPAYAAWLRRIGIRHLEISDGTVSIEAVERARLIREFAAGGFAVVTEIGKKARDVEPDPAAWIAAIRADLAAGAESVILEGREYGTAGLYTPAGTLRPELFQALIAAELPVERLIFEAPRTAQQATLITQLGPEVSFGNIAWHDIIPLETLRRGLRGDTAGSITRDTLLHATRRASR